MQTIPDASGDMNHEATTLANETHLIPVNPLATTVNPSIAPRMECVPETGRRRRVAKRFHSADPVKTDQVSITPHLGNDISILSY